MKQLIVALALAVLTAIAPAKADEQAVQDTIAAQLDAFRVGDAAAAYSFAAPSIKRMFPTPEVFITMVRRGYAPVYHASQPVFLRAREMGPGSYAQEVGLVDKTGKSWTALYTLAKQDDGTWRITGCYLRADKALDT